MGRAQPPCSSPGIGSARLVHPYVFEGHNGLGQAKTRANDATGFGAAIQALRSGKAARVCLEATGADHLALTLALEAAGLAVMVVNPHAAKRFAEALATHITITITTTKDRPMRQPDQVLPQLRHAPVNTGTVHDSAGAAGAAGRARGGRRRGADNARSQGWRWCEQPGGGWPDDLDHGRVSVRQRLSKSRPVGKPAARIGDMHTCPMVDPGPKPHVGGPIMPPGCPTVLIGGLPAARVGDMAVCVGPPDSIVRGSPTVLIGGMPAARMGDSTAHGGVVVAGCPTVLIGDGAAPRAVTTVSSGGMLGALVGGLIGGVGGAITGLIAGGPVGAIAGAVAGALIGAAVGHALTSQQVTRFGDSITITGDPAFREQTVRDLRTIEGTPSGQALLDAIDGSGRSVRITQCQVGNDGAWDGPWDNADLYNGRGADAQVGVSGVRTPMYNSGADWDNPPTAVTLGHELTHAAHITNGTLPGNPTLMQNRMLEERRTVGLGADPARGLPDFAAEPYSENALRRDLHEPPRTSYTDPSQANPW